MSEGRREWAERIADQFGVTDAAALDAIEEGVQRGLSLATRPEQAVGEGLADEMRAVAKRYEDTMGLTRDGAIRRIGILHDGLLDFADRLTALRAAKPADEQAVGQVYPDNEGGLVREFLEFAEFVKDNPPMQKRQVSVRMIQAVAAALRADEGLRAALEKCRAQFDHYVSLHMAKQPPDMDKAAANQEFVELCDAELSETVK